MPAQPPRRRPLPKGETFFTPGATGLRRQVERRSAPFLLYLHQLPVWVVPLSVVALLVVGLAVKGAIGAAALVALAAFLGWFSYLSWPSLQPRGRFLRCLVIAAVIAFAAGQAVR